MQRKFTILLFGILSGIFSSMAQELGNNLVAGSPRTVQHIAKDQAFPIKLNSFSVRRNGTDIILNWQTHSEINNNYFEIQRSADGIEFKTIALMFAWEEATRGASYRYNDNGICNGPDRKIWYRLKQVDMGVNISFSRLKKLSLPENLMD